MAKNTMAGSCCHRYHKKLLPALSRGMAAFYKSIRLAERGMEQGAVEEK
jgi:hypothetical protein